MPKIIRIAAVTIALVLLASPALADMRIEMTRGYNYSYSNGGEFTITALDELVGVALTGTHSDIASQSNSFQTFCV